MHRFSIKMFQTLIHPPLPTTAIKQFHSLCIGSIFICNRNSLKNLLKYADHVWLEQYSKEKWQLSAKTNIESQSQGTPISQILTP